MDLSEAALHMRLSSQRLIRVAIHNTAMLQVLVSGPGQQWRDYFVCRGTSALICLLQQLTAPDASPAATFAASRALAGLAASSANQGDIIKVGYLKIISGTVQRHLGITAQDHDKFFWLTTAES